MKYVKDAGFNFTKEDIELVKAELSDEDVENIAGGAWFCFLILPLPPVPT
jgi:hypothetical protein